MAFPQSILDKAFSPGWIGGKPWPPCPTKSFGLGEAMAPVPGPIHPGLKALSRVDWGEAMALVPPGYALVAHFIIKLSSFNAYRNSLNCISSVTGVKNLHFIRKINGHIL